MELLNEQVEPAAARAGGRKGRTVVCQVDSCGEVLSTRSGGGALVPLAGIKAYHLRYRLCEVHLRAEAVPVSGVDSRFCQKCSRWHPLGDYEGAKRTCRKMLLAHNTRRRDSRSSGPRASQPSAGDAEPPLYSAGGLDLKRLLSVASRGQTSHERVQELLPALVVGALPAGCAPDVVAALTQAALAALAAQHGGGPAEADAGTAM